MTIHTPNNSYAIFNGDGTQTAFSFPFANDRFEDDDVFVYLWNGTSEVWDKKTVTTDYTLGSNTVTFGSAPSAPPAGVTGNILIVRKTDVDEDFPKADFQPGSSIRAQDLDNNQLQALRALKELRDGKLSRFAQVNETDGTVSNPKMYANLDMTGRRIENLGGANSDDDAVTREQLGDLIALDITGDGSQGVNLIKTQGGTNSGDELEISMFDSSPTQKGTVIIEPAAGEAINVSYDQGTATIGVDRSTPSQQGVVSIQQAATESANVVYTADGEVTIGVDRSTADQQGSVRIQSTTPITTTYTADGEVELTIQDGSIDVGKIKPEDIRTLAEQNANPNVTGNDDEFGTTAANDKRYDVIYQSGTPLGADFVTGKLWYDHTNDQTLYVWNGLNWLGISSGGTFITQPTVIWVDSVNGDDANDGHRIIDAMKTIKAAVTSADDGDIVLVNPGIYREELPIDVTVNNLSIVGQSLRSCFVHPTPATEENTMFRVNSGTLISNFSFAGLKASGTRGDHYIDSDATYGLPQNQGWVAEFYPNAVIYKSPYIQNCTNFTDSAIDNHTEEEFSADPDVTGYFDPNNVQQGGFGGDLTSDPTGGGILIDGSVPHVDSPLRSMVVDAFTQITLDGPGLLCCNNGYGQLVSFFGTFCHYHAKALNGGQLNLSNCTTDYGRYGLIADGKSLNTNFTAGVDSAAAIGDITFTIGPPTPSAGWYGSTTRPQDNMSVTVGGHTYPIREAVQNGTGWDVTIENPDPNANKTNLGLKSALTTADNAEFFNRSYISTGGHTFEYVGAGTDYRAAPENGGVAIEANQVKNLNGGQVFQSSTDHNGKFKIGTTFTVNQRTGEVDISLDAYRPEVVNDLSPQLGGDLDVNNFDIVNNTTNGNLGVRINGVAYPTSDGNQDNIMVTDGSGQLRFEPLSNLTGTGLQNIVDDTTPQLGGDLDVNGNKIVSVSNGDIIIDPDGTGAVKIGDTSGGQLSHYISITDRKILHNGNGDLEIEAGGGGYSSAGIDIKSFITTTINQDLDIWPRGTGNVNFNPFGINGTRLIGVDDPVNAQDAATKNYVDTTSMPLAGGTFTGTVTFSDGTTIDDYVSQTSSTGSAELPVGTTAQRDASPANGMLRYNSTENEFEGYANGAWGQIGGGSGATGGGSDLWAFEHDNTITTSYTITTGKNVISAGPLTINSGVVITVPSGSNWTIA